MMIDFLFYIAAPANTSLILLAYNPMKICIEEHSWLLRNGNMKGQQRMSHSLWGVVSKSNRV